MIRIVEARAEVGHTVWLRFQDGTAGSVDLSDLAGRGVFAAWADREVFESLLVSDAGALEWPGGLDLCGDALYLRLTGKATHEVFPRLRSTPAYA